MYFFFLFFSNKILEQEEATKIYADLDAVQNAIVSSSHPEFHAEVDLQDISYSDLNNYLNIHVCSSFPPSVPPSIWSHHTSNF